MGDVPFHQRASDALDIHPVSVSKHHLSELLAEAARRCDPGDTDIDALVEALGAVAVYLDSETMGDAGDEVARAAALIEQAFGERT